MLNRIADGWIIESATSAIDIEPLKFYVLDHLLFHLGRLVKDGRHPLEDFFRSNKLKVNLSFSSERADLGVSKDLRESFT